MLWLNQKRRWRWKILRKQTTMHALMKGQLFMKRASFFFNNSSFNSKIFIICLCSISATFRNSLWKAFIPFRRWDCLGGGRSMVAAAAGNPNRWSTSLSHLPQPNVSVPHVNTIVLRCEFGRFSACHRTTSQSNSVVNGGVSSAALMSPATRFVRGDISEILAWTCSRQLSVQSHS